MLAHCSHSLVIKNPHIYNHSQPVAGSVKMAVLVITIVPRVLESSSNALCHRVDHGDPVGGTSVLQICHDYPICSMVAEIIAT